MYIEREILEKNIEWRRLLSEKSQDIKNHTINFLNAHF